MQSRLQAPSCQHRARHRTQTHGLRHHDLSRSRTLNRLSHSGAPRLSSFFTSLPDPMFLVYGVILYILLKIRCWGTWVAQSVKRPTLAQVMISQSRSLSPTPGSVLTAQSLEPASHSVSPSLCPFPAHALSLSVSKINIKKNFFLNKKIVFIMQGLYVSANFGSAR